MPTFKLERSVAGLSDDDLAAGGYRAVSCAKRYPGLVWLRSYFDREAKRTTCFYVSPSRDVLVAHQADAQLEFETIIEVEEFDASIFYDEPAVAS